MFGKKAIRDNQKRKRKEIEYQNIDLIEYDDLMDEYLSTLKEFKDRKNKENGFSFKKTLNIMMLNDNSSKKKQRDTSSMKRFDCCGEINIIINLEMKTTLVNVIHKILHELPKEVSIPKCVKDFISENIDLLPKEIYARLVENGSDPEIRQNQIYFWWSKLGETRYKRDSNSFLSAKTLLEEYNCIKILDIDLPVQAIAFETRLYQMLIENNILIKEFGIDANKSINNHMISCTYNTNNLGFELYVIHAEVDGAGFPLAYLFLEHNGKCGDSIRTKMITKFVLQLKEKGLDPEFILTDKDWAQIKACHSTWPKAKIQLCRWHINRAITTRLQSDKIVT
ncbi:unnamed protein product [Rhizophagus irregularis]|nr:unnamed protein product [Rhizophagus irregularis]